MSIPRGAAKLKLSAYTVSSHAPIASTSKSVVCQRVATARQFSSKPERRSARDTDAGSDLLNLLDRARNAPDATSSPSSSKGGYWDQILSDIDTAAADSYQSATSAARKQRPTSAGSLAPRRVTMTIREQHAADEMFNQIFDSMSAAIPGAEGHEQRQTGGLSALMGALSRSRRVTKPGEDPELELELDKMNEVIDNALSDHELLQWAEREVFAQSFQLASAADALMKNPEKNAQAINDAPLQAATYPHAIAKLMRTFRDKYRDPHLALAIFAHARGLSTYSYVMGCTTPAYNELIQTRWECFRDLRGVYEAVQEMATNKVRRDNRTRVLWENIRRELGSSTSPNDGLYDILGRIDQMVGKDPPRRERSLRGETFDQRMGREKRVQRDRKQGGARNLNAWRNPAALEGQEEGLEFGEWERPAEKESL